MLGLNTLPYLSFGFGTLAGSLFGGILPMNLSTLRETLGQIKKLVRSLITNIQEIITDRFFQIHMRLKIIL